jgi:hypothetical protein
MAGGPYIPVNIDKILGPKKKRIGVWQRKSESEIKAIQEQINKSANSMVMPIGVSIISGFTCHITMNMISHSKILYCIASSIFAFIFTFIVQRIKGRALALSPRIKICNKCLKEDWIGLKRCHFGGTMESPEFYNFIEKVK